jgi:hypothetical protein
LPSQDASQGLPGTLEGVWERKRHSPESSGLSPRPLPPCPDSRQNRLFSPEKSFEDPRFAALRASVLPSPFFRGAPRPLPGLLRGPWPLAKPGAAAGIFELSFQRENEKNHIIFGLSKITLPVATTLEWSSTAQQPWPGKHPSGLLYYELNIVFSNINIYSYAIRQLINRLNAHTNHLSSAYKIYYNKNKTQSFMAQVFSRFSLHNAIFYSAIFVISSC